MLFTETEKLLKFVRWPKSTPTGKELREWLNHCGAPEVEPQALTKLVT